MPPSQLKRLKASLREQGIVGPQKSKKQKKQIAQNSSNNNDKRVNRNAALTGIREQFNPFEVKSSARGPKFDVTSNKTMSGRITKSVKGRPGMKKGLGEEAVGLRLFPPWLLLIIGSAAKLFSKRCNKETKLEESWTVDLAKMTRR